MKVKAAIKILETDGWCLVRTRGSHRQSYYEKLVGNLKGCYSRRINIKHRLVYRVIKETQTVEIIRMWSHYE